MSSLVDAGLLTGDGFLLMVKPRERLKRLNRSELPVDLVLDIAIQLCSVLDYLHSRPVSDHFVI